MLIIHNEADSFEANPVPLAPLKAIFPACSHLITGRDSNWKQAISDGQRHRQRGPLIQSCLGRVGSHRHVQLGLSQGLSWEQESGHIPGGVGKTDKITEVWGRDSPTRRVSPGPCAVPVSQGPFLCHGRCRPCMGVVGCGWLVFQSSLLGRYKVLGAKY